MLMLFLLVAEPHEANAECSFQRVARAQHERKLCLENAIDIIMERARAAGARSSVVIEFFLMSVFLPLFLQYNPDNNATGSTQ